MGAELRQAGEALADRLVPQPPQRLRPVGAHQHLLQVVELDSILGNLAQRDDRVLVVVAVERQRRARGDLARPLGGQQDQLEAVRNLDNAIFDGNPCHPLTLQSPNLEPVEYMGRGTQRQQQDPRKTVQFPRGNPLGTGPARMTR